MKSPTIKAILLDFDGTIACSLPSWHVAYRRVFLQRGFEISVEELSAHMFCGKYNERAEEIENMHDFHDTVYDEVLPGLLNSPLMPGITNVLARATSYKFAVISNTRTSVVHKYIAGHNLSDVLSVVIGADAVLRPKPDPEMLVVAMKRLGVNPKECVFIGDASSDVQAGNSALVRTIQYMPKLNEPFYRFETNVKSGEVVTNFEDFISLLHE